MRKINCWLVLNFLLLMLGWVTNGEVSTVEDISQVCTVGIVLEADCYGV